MEKIMRPVWAEIDLDAIAYNISNVKKLVGDKEVIAVVKSDCYGHGVLDVVPCLLENGASRLAIAMLSEAIELRKNSISCPIMILGYTPPHLFEELIKYDIEQTVYDLEYAKELSKVALSLNKKAKIHIAVDTGMGRIGFFPNQTSLNAISTIYSLSDLETVGIFTHFSSSDEKEKDYTNFQFNKITEFIHELSNKGINIPIKHAANSGAIVDMPKTHLDAVRAGIILYGYYPSNNINKANLLLKPALTLKATISHVKEMDKGMYIGYNRTFKTKRKSIIATIPIGYADGYTRKLAKDGKVLVNGKLAKIVGTICMDQFMIDVTDIKDVKTGDEVTLLGEYNSTKLNADTLAEFTGTINYEVLCTLRHRIPRVYIKNGVIVNVRNYV